VSANGPAAKAALGEARTASADGLVTEVELQEGGTVSADGPATKAGLLERMGDKVRTVYTDGPATSTDKIGMAPEVRESDVWYKKDGGRRVARSSIDKSWSLSLSTWISEEWELVVVMVVTLPACKKRPVA
jgi:hypothetical protein